MPATPATQGNDRCIKRSPPDEANRVPQTARRLRDCRGQGLRGLSFNKEQLQSDKVIIPGRSRSFAPQGCRRGRYTPKKLTYCFYTIFARASYPGHLQPRARNCNDDRHCRNNTSNLPFRQGLVSNGTCNAKPLPTLLLCRIVPEIWPLAY